MTRNAKPGLPRAVDGAMGAPQRFWGGSVIYNGKKVKIALYLAVFVTRDREGYVLHMRRSCALQARVPSALIGLLGDLLDSPGGLSAVPAPFAQRVGSVRVEAELPRRPD